MSDKKDRLEDVLYNNIHELESRGDYTLDFDELTSAIRLWIEQNLPKEKQGIKFHGAREDKYSPTDHEKVGFNSCLAQVKKNLLEE